MKERAIDNEITLIPYYRNDEVLLPWYQDPDVCKQVDNRDEPYTLELLHCMYDFSAHTATASISNTKAYWWEMFPSGIMLKLLL